MLWSKPEFVEITLCMEVTAYVNTEDAVRARHPAAVVRGEEQRPADDRPPVTDR